MTENSETLYYAPGKLEWHLRIPTGKGNYIVIPLVGGAFTSQGMACGSFKTSNPVIRHLIENSAEFREGRIMKRR